MKIYFCGSIRGGRENKEVYCKMINHMKNYGKVLTEEVGDDALIELKDKELSNTDIYERDMIWLVDSDIAIAEVSTPSLGVGYELRFIEESKKRHLLLYGNNSERRLSAMISGNGFFNIKTYKSLEEALGYIDDFMKGL